MLDIRRTLRNSMSLTAIALAVVATAADGQPDPELINLPRRNTLAGEKTTGLSDNLPPLAVHKCRFRVNVYDGGRFAGLNLSGNTPAGFDRTYGTIFPVGTPAPTHQLVMTYLGVDYMGMRHWKFLDSSKARCTLPVPRYGESTKFRNCSTDLEWMGRGSIY